LVDRKLTGDIESSLLIFCCAAPLKETAMIRQKDKISIFNFIGCQLL
jgi:hypothetical protein